jgi:hypothetical protein
LTWFQFYVSQLHVIGVCSHSLQNLNRCYESPTLDLHPAVYGSHALITQLVREHTTAKNNNEQQQQQRGGVEVTPPADTSVGVSGGVGGGGAASVGDDTGVFLYLDLHAHANKKGCFIYGNHQVPEAAAAAAEAEAAAAAVVAASSSSGSSSSSSGSSSSSSSSGSSKQ